MASLPNVRVAVIAADGFEESELLEPVHALRKVGAQVDILSLECGEVQGFKHHEQGTRVKVDRLLGEATAADYDALLLPGGALNADRLRAEPRVRAFVREIQMAGKPIAAICHAPWILISANLVKGRTLTSYHSIQDDITNAGGTWVDQEASVDRNWVTSRQPSDLHAFNREMIDLFSRHRTISTLDEPFISPEARKEYAKARIS